MRRRHALVVGLAGLTAACARTSSAPPTVVIPPTPLPARTPSPQPLAAATPLATALPTATSVPAPTATPVAETQIVLDVHLWNGAAEVQLPGLATRRWSDPYEVCGTTSRAWPPITAPTWSTSAPVPKGLPGATL